MTSGGVAELRKAEARAHILEGFKIALDHIDEFIKIIRASQTGDEAKTNWSRFGLSEKQASAILERGCDASRAWSGMNHCRLEAVRAEIARLRAILEDEGLVESSKRKWWLCATSMAMNAVPGSSPPRVTSIWWTDPLKTWSSPYPTKAMSSAYPSKNIALAAGWPRKE